MGWLVILHCVLLVMTVAFSTSKSPRSQLDFLIQVVGLIRLIARQFEGM